MEEFGYPEARRLDLTEDVLGHQVSDPYRWLEDAGSAERADWLRAQADLFGAHREELPGRDDLAEQVRTLLNVGYVGTPVWRGERYFFTRRDPGQEHGVLCTRLADGPLEVLLDPMAIDPSGLTTLDAWQPDKEGRLLAYQLSEGGDEESLLRVMDVSTGALADGPIDRCRYSNVAWLPGGKAFYYTRRLPPSAVPEGESQYHRRVYLHQVGTSADEDVLIFGTGRDKTDYYSVSVSRDGRWLAISASRGTAPRNDLWLADLSESDPAEPRLRVIQEGLDAQTWVRASRDGRLYVSTDADAPRGRIAVADPAKVGGPATWRDLIREDPEAVLTGYAILDGPELDRPVLLASWARHALSEITVHDLETGERLGQVPLPGAGTVGGLSERPEGGHEAWFVYTDYTTSSVVLRFDARGSSVSTWATAPGSTGVPAVTARQVTYPSKDGTQVRMLVISAADSGTPPSPRPTILYGYGGFDISLTPAYSPNVLAWVAAGGVYAIANLRGGSEEGEEWHRAGMLDRKQIRLRRFSRRRGDADPGRVDHAGAAGHLGRVERRAAGRRGAGTAAGAVRGRHLLGAAARHGALRAIRPRADLEHRVRHRVGCGATRLAAFLLALPPCGRGHQLPGRAVHRVHQRHPGRPGARVQDVRGAAARHVVRAARAAAGGGPGGARGAGGEPVGRAVRGHTRVRRSPYRA